MDRENTQRGSEIGSAQDWPSLDYSHKPDLDYNEQVYDLLEVMREMGLQTVADYRNFLAKEKIKKYMDELPSEAKVMALFDIAFYPYANGHVGIADMVMEEMRLDEKQQKDFSKGLSLMAMEGQCDLDGIRTYTFSSVVARVLKFYPDLKDDEQMIAAAKGAFLTEFDQINREEDFKSALVYPEMGLFKLEEVKTDQYLVGGVVHKLLNSLKSRDADIAIKIAQDFVSHETRVANQKQIEAAAEAGFKYIFGHYAEDDRLLADTFLPNDFLQRPEIITFIRDAFKEKLEKGYLGGCVGIGDYFGDVLPENFRNTRIWESDLASVVKHAILENIREGNGEDIKEFKAKFGIPEDFIEDPDCRQAVVEGLRKCIKWYTKADEPAVLIDVLGLSSEVWKYVFTHDYLLSIFNETEEYLNLSKLEEFVEKFPELREQIDDREIANLMTAITSSERTLNSEMLEKFVFLSKTFPKVKEYLDIPAGGEYPSGATIDDLLEICSKSGLMKYALQESYAFTIEEAKELSDLTK